MSVTTSKADGVTVYTLTSDPQSPCPPLCQILKGLCYSPACCSLSRRLRGVQTSQLILGALQIMVGLLNIGLGAVLASAYSYWRSYPVYPFWLGGVFLLFGILNIVSEKCPSPCLALVNVILNLSGVGFAIASIILYSLDVAFIYMWWLCDDDYFDYGRLHDRATQSPIMKQKCLEGEELVLLLMTSLNSVLIVLSVLELCLVISSAVLGIKALRSGGKGEQSNSDPEGCKPLLEEVTNHPAA